MSRGAAIARALSVAAVVLAVDQATKALVRGSIERGGEEPLGLGISLVNTRNTGVAFGLFQGGGVLLIIFAVVAILGIVAFLVALSDRPGTWMPLGLLAGGAVGNLVDRVASGAVTDFIDFSWWPAFNVADMAITAGVLSMLWVLEGPRARRRPA